VREREREKNLIVANFKADPDIPEFGPVTFLASLNIDLFLVYLSTFFNWRNYIGMTLDNDSKMIRNIWHSILARRIEFYFPRYRDWLCISHSLLSNRHRGSFSACKSGQNMKLINFDDYHLLGDDTVWLLQEPTLRRIVSPPSSGCTSASWLQSEVVSSCIGTDS
jgi:hypothetical protein